MPIIISSGSYFLFFCLALNVVTLMVPYWWIDEDNYGLWGTCKCIWNYNVGDTHSKGMSTSVYNRISICVNKSYNAYVNYVNMRMYGWF